MKKKKLKTILADLDIIEYPFDVPFSWDTIKNQLQIDLYFVNGFSCVKQHDGRLTNLTINFEYPDEEGDEIFPYIQEECHSQKTNHCKDENDPHGKELGKFLKSLGLDKGFFLDDEDIFTKVPDMQESSPVKEKADMPKSNEKIPTKDEPNFEMIRDWLEKYKNNSWATKEYLIEYLNSLINMSKQTIKSPIK